MAQLEIWIELPKVETFEEADAHCKAANKMLQKLDCPGEYFWACENQKYCHTFYNYSSSGNASHGFEELGDRGKWFNLEYLGK